MRKLHWSLLKRIHRLRGRFAVYARLNRQWLLDSGNWVDQQLIIRRPYEVEQLKRCRQLIETHRLQLFLDIGANFGLYSVLLSDASGITEMHAFEPLPRNLHQLGANLFLNDLDQRVQVHGHALSDRSGRFDFHVDPHSTGVSTLLPGDTRSHSDYRATVQVEARVFDEVCAFVGQRALVKIDVEGAEVMVLTGMRRFLAENTVFLQVETTAQTLPQVDALMSGAGYQLLGRLGSDSYYGKA